MNCDTETDHLKLFFFFRFCEKNRFKTRVMTDFPPKMGERRTMSRKTDIRTFFHVRPLQYFRILLLFFSVVIV